MPKRISSRAFPLHILTFIWLHGESFFDLVLANSLRLDGSDLASKFFNMGTQCIISFVLFTSRGSNLGVYLVIHLVCLFLFSPSSLSRIYTWKVMIDSRGKLFRKWNEKNFLETKYNRSHNSFIPPPSFLVSLGAHSYKPSFISSIGLVINLKWYLSPFKLLLNFVIIIRFGLLGSKF